MITLFTGFRRPERCAVKPFHISTPIRKLGDGLALIGGLAIVLMMFHIVGDVVMSKFLNDPIDGTTEVVSAYYMVAVVFLPTAFVTFSVGQLSAELFTARLRGYALSFLTGINGLLSTAYLLFIIFFTAVEAISRTAEGEAWETSVDLVAVWPSRWFLPIGLGAMAICVFYQSVQHLRGKEDFPGKGKEKGF